MFLIISCLGVCCWHVSADFLSSDVWLVGCVCFVRGLSFQCSFVSFSTRFLGWCVDLGSFVFVFLDVSGG